MSDADAQLIKEIRMKKSVVLVILASATFASSIPAFSQASSSSSGGKIKNGAKAVGRGVMWGPKKVGQGLKKVGTGTKKVFHKGT